MYLCICHGLNERAVESACSYGADNARLVYRHFGVKPQCGKCVGTVQCAVESHHATTTPVQQREQRHAE